MGGDLSTSAMYPSFSEDGTMQIASSAQLSIFAVLVNAGNTTLNACLTADVSVGESFAMIGKDGVNYAGTFDGQGHTIEANINKPENDCVGIFAYAGDATIRNLRVTGSIVGRTNVAMIGRSLGKTHISGVESNLNVLGYNNIGGFIGNASKGPQQFFNCLFTGKSTVDMNISGSSGAGGFVGWSNVPVTILRRSDREDLGRKRNIAGSTGRGKFFARSRQRIHARIILERFNPARATSINRLAYNFRNERLDFVHQLFLRHSDAVPFHHAEFIVMMGTEFIFAERLCNLENVTESRCKQSLHVELGARHHEMLALDFKVV